MERIGRFYGIGVGPGDPDLLTLKANKILKGIDVLFFPKGKKTKEGKALTIVKDLLPSSLEMIELPFPMTRDKRVLERYWKGNAQRIWEELKKGKDCAFITLGDPLIYSTFNYLLRELENLSPQAEIEIVPGISSFQVAAAKGRISLVKGGEKMAIVPCPERLSTLKETFEKFETVILFKVGKRLEELKAFLEKEVSKKRLIFASRLGEEGEQIKEGLAGIGVKKRDYLSLVIIKSMDYSESHK